jgi:hypothetical protein
MFSLNQAVRLIGTSTPARTTPVTRCVHGPFRVYGFSKLCAQIENSNTGKLTTIYEKNILGKE